MCYLIDNSIVIPSEIFYYISSLMTSRNILNFAKSFDKQLFPPILSHIFHKIKRKENLEKLKKHVGAKPFFPKNMINATASDEENIYPINSPINVMLGNQLIGKLMRTRDLLNRNFCWMILVIIPTNCLKKFENLTRRVAVANDIVFISKYDSKINGKKQRYIQIFLKTNGFEKYENYTVAYNLIWRLRELIRSSTFTMRWIV
ncbi:hypothetical protein QLL95_gp0040 [Cotonvirus japonicus]|uniref:Uncharacterized protein n=1 Tax=Cotonvirus japonicus TaxID=2811091 RepID=A0ABM7NQT4_9VIRU|nr:hypothetical protein QLL95_gp0040 [Cotonvirus japonicus]BCS82529.1 hypothetical protein [Cotonvirus japonicus]